MMKWRNSPPWSPRGRLRKRPPVWMDSRPPNPKEAGGKNSIRIDRVRVVPRVNGTSGPGKKRFCRGFQRVGRKYLLGRKTGLPFPNSRELEMYAGKSLALRSGE